MWEYDPDSLEEIIGNEDSIRKAKEWAESWDMESDAMVLYGPPGVGKTTCAHQIADACGWDVIEMNASDQRTKSKIMETAGESSISATLTGNRRLIIIDESDNLHGNIDRGGKKAIRDVVKNSNQPIILIANDYYELSRSLRNNLNDVGFDPVDTGKISSLLAKICEERDIGYSRSDLISIARKSNGDVRGAINDLRRYESESTSSQERKTKDGIFEFLDKVLKTSNGLETRSKARNLDETPYELFNWIEANIFREYDADEIENSVENISRASIWLGRTNRTQTYRFWKYVTDNLTVGVQLGRNHEHLGWTRWQTPRYSSGYTISKDTARKVSEVSNCSTNTARSEICLYLRDMIPYCKPKDLAVGIADQYNFNAENLSEVTGSGKSTNKVKSIVQTSSE